MYASFPLERISQAYLKYAVAEGNAISVKSDRLLIWGDFVFRWSSRGRRGKQNQRLFYKLTKPISDAVRLPGLTFPDRKTVCPFCNCNKETGQKYYLHFQSPSPCLPKVIFKRWVPFSWNSTPPGHRNCDLFSCFPSARFHKTGKILSYPSISSKKSCFRPSKWKLHFKKQCMTKKAIPVQSGFSFFPSLLSFRCQMALRIILISSRTSNCKKRVCNQSDISHEKSRAPIIPSSSHQSQWHLWCRQSDGQPAVRSADMHARQLAAGCRQQWHCVFTAEGTFFQPGHFFILFPFSLSFLSKLGRCLHTHAVYYVAL